MAEGLKFNWNRFEEQGLVESEKAKPSSDPKWWAKRSCNKCLGRGVMGIQTSKVGTNTLKSDILCDCVKKRFVKWRNDFIYEYAQKQRAAILESADNVDKGQ